MMSAEEFKIFALSLPGTEANPHFDRTAFKVTGKRIFATLHLGSNTANIKLSEVDQSVFCSFDKGMAYPVPNKWGLQGWTTIKLDHAPEELIKDAVETAYKEVLKAKKK